MSIEGISAQDLSFLNSLTGLVSAVAQQQQAYAGKTISQSDPIEANLRWYMISNFRQLLSQLYVEHGIVQTLIDQPVDDAFRAGFDIKSANLDGDDIEALEVYLEEHDVIDTIMQAMKWARLYGGGGVLAITPQDPSTPLDIRSIRQGSPLEFRDADMWELYYSQVNTTATADIGGYLGANDGDFYDYYGQKVHASRVFPIKGKRAPSFIRPRLRGWAMSEVERLVRSLNQYLKNQDVIFELLDEAKVDVYRMEGFNNALMQNGSTEKISARVAMSNQIKNYNSGILMDAKDEYVQKQISFTGLNDMLVQIRQGIASDLKMPITKIFGVSASGFNSGEDDIENYNSMVEGEIRRKAKRVVIKVLQMCCMNLFGTEIPDLQIKFRPLRVLSAEQEEKVKNDRFNRIMTAYSAGLATAQETKEAINKDSSLPVELDPNTDALPPPNGGGDMSAEDGGAASGKHQAKDVE